MDFKEENTSKLEKCLESKENAKICASSGLDKAQEFANKSFNDLKSYLKWFMYYFYDYL